MFTHLGNKCFRTRDITFSKKFVAALGGLDEKAEPVSGGHRWKRIRSVPAFIVEGQREWDGTRALKELKFGINRVQNTRE